MVNIVSGGCHRKEGEQGSRAHEESLTLETSGCILAKGLLGPKSCCSHSLSVLCASWCLQGEVGGLAGHLLHTICNPGRRIKATYCIFYFLLQARLCSLLPYLALSLFFSFISIFLSITNIYPQRFNCLNFLFWTCICLLACCNSLGLLYINCLIFNVVIMVSFIRHHKNTFWRSVSESVERRYCTLQVDKLNIYMERMGDLGCNEKMKYLYCSIMNGVCNLVSE